MNTRNMMILFAVFALILSACTTLRTNPDQQGNPGLIQQQTVSYNPVINPEDFSSNVDNKYFKLTPGKKLIYEAQTPEGLERIEVYVLKEKVNIMGIETVAVWDRVWVDGDLKEDTIDWYAQDKLGNVWYFGEDTKELEFGKVLNHNGAWKSGINGAKPGIIMEADPKVGDSYYQEYYKGEAEDRADVLSVNEDVETKAGKFRNCIKTYDYTQLNLNSKEHKYYCPEVGDLSLVEDITTGEKLQLISVEYGAEPTKDEIMAYDPVIVPTDFSTKIDNKFMKITPGKKMVYEKKTAEGIEKIEVYVTNETKKVLGVETIVVWDRVWLDGDLIEDTFDWYAQDKLGNVWYFGEDTKELKDGNVLNHNGAWTAGVDGAKPGIVMEAAPKVGDSYKQEYYRGVAEDRADVLSTTEIVSVRFGTMNGCIKTYDYTPLDAKVKEFKYYCPSVGGIALEEEDDERLELISVEYDALPSIGMEKTAETVDTTTPATETDPGQISEEEAKEIALNEVPGIVTGVERETFSGKQVYVVQIEPENGPETDIMIDIETGAVLNVET